MKKVTELTPKSVTEFVKLLSAVQDLAKINKAYYDSLIEAGFTKEQAFNMVKDYKWF